MKKTKILAALLLLTLSVSLQMQATEVIHNKTYNAQNNGGARSVKPSVQADIENNVISIEIKRYTGTALIYIYNNEGTPVSMRSINVEGSASSIIDVSEQEQGKYTLCVVLGETAFSGCFNVE